MRLSLLILVTAIVVAGAWPATGAQPSTGGQDFGQIQPPRDTPAQPESATETASISGRVVDARTGEPLKRARVAATSRGGQGRLAFPANEQLWQPQSRYIKASRPDQNAHYRIEGLPAGEYLLAAVEVVEQGEWFDPRFLERLRPVSANLSIDDGESQELNLTLSPQPQ